VWIGAVPGLAFLENNQMALAFYVDVVALLVAAWMIHRLPLGGRRATKHVREVGPVATGRPRCGPHRVREGWRSSRSTTPKVRAVNLGLATGLIGGGMLVPLGVVFSNEVLGAGDAGFGVLVFALGAGVAVGVGVIAGLQRRLPKPEAFTAAVLAAGALLVIAASTSALAPAAVLVGAIGACAGAVYVLGFTILHEHVEDHVRGRVFGALYTLVRMSVLLAFLVGPFLAELLDALSRGLVDRELELFGATLFVPGVRLTLWLAGAIIIGAGLLASWSVRAPDRRDVEADERVPAGAGRG
jgi:dTMP kinase